jgi:hypothetical protein
VFGRRISGKKRAGSRYERDTKWVEAAKVTSFEIQLPFLPIKINFLNITLPTT